MVPEYLHTWLRVRIIRRLEPQLVYTHLPKERAHEPDQVSQRQVVVRNHTLDLVELSQVSRVDGFIPEYTVDREVARGARVLGELVQHGGGDGGRVRAQNESEGFGFLPRVAITETAVFAFLVHFAHVVPVFGQRGASLVVAGRVGGHRVGDIKGVLEVTGGVLLWDEEGIKVPEAGFDEAGIVVSWC